MRPGPGSVSVASSFRQSKAPSGHPLPAPIPVCLWVYAASSVINEVEEGQELPAHSLKLTQPRSEPGLWILGLGQSPGAGSQVGPLTQLTSQVLGQGHLDRLHSGFFEEWQRKQGEMKEQGLHPSLCPVALGAMLTFSPGSVPPQEAHQPDPLDAHRFLVSVLLPYGTHEPFCRATRPLSLPGPRLGARGGWACPAPPSQEHLALWLLP